jgi:transcription initiation factor TFIID TATA-box-binding protein
MHEQSSTAGTDCIQMEVHECRGGCGCTPDADEALHADNLGFGWDGECEGRHMPGCGPKELFCNLSQACESHREMVWSTGFQSYQCRAGVEESFQIPRGEELAELMLGIIPPCLGGDVQDWEKGDESDTTVHNMVSTSVVSGSEMPINLWQLATLLPCSTYDRKKFAAITIRMDNPRCTALLFTSGKLVVTGVKSWCECLLASLCIARIISMQFVHARYFIVNCEVQNIVAHSEIKLGEGQMLNIQRMYECMAMECTYQRNMFPGLIYRGKDAPVVLLCFYSGKVVLTGGKTVRDIEWGWNMLWKIVRRFVE